MSLYSHAIIFAGGQSSRMGKDKALLPFGKYSSLTAYQYEKLKKLFHTVYISAKEDKFDFDCHVIKDTHEDDSPLVGILSLFETLEDAEEVFILSVDSPFVDSEVIIKIMETEADNFDVIIAQSPSGLQPLCGRYRRSILPLAKQQHEKGNHKLKDLLTASRTKIVNFEEDTPFTNLNHPEEYQEALKRFINR